MLDVRFYKRRKVDICSRRSRFSFVCILLILLSIFPLLEIDSTVGNFTRRVFSYWTSVDKDFGKLKYVFFPQSQEEVVNGENNIDFVCPFNSCVISKNSNGESEVVGTSDLFKAVSWGKVESVHSNGKEKIITIDHGDGIKSIYQFVGQLCVKNNDRVESGYIGIASQKKLILTITKNDDVLEIVGQKDGLLEVKL